jgi:hypothetical protein
VRRPRDVEISVKGDRRLLTLKEAKSALMGIRKNITTAQQLYSSNVAEPAPQFSLLSADVNMQEILRRRWDEIQACITANANLSATVMMGGLLESLLLARINLESDKKKVYGAKSVPRDRSGKPLPLSEWKLVNMVSVGHDNGWITKSAKDVGNVLREFRNYIHPHKEHTDAVVITSDDVRMFWEVSKIVTKQVLESVA